MIGWPGEVAGALNSQWVARHRVLLVVLLCVSWPPRAMVSALLMSKCEYWSGMKGGVTRLGWVVTGMAGLSWVRLC